VGDGKLMKYRKRQFEIVDLCPPNPHTGFLSLVNLSFFVKQYNNSSSIGLDGMYIKLPWTVKFLYGQDEEPERTLCEHNDARDSFRILW